MPVLATTATMEEVLKHLGNSEQILSMTGLKDEGVLFAKKFNIFTLNDTAGWKNEIELAITESGNEFKWF